MLRKPTTYHSSQCLIEFQNYMYMCVRSLRLSSFVIFHQLFTSISPRMRYFPYVRYGNDNVILFIGYSLSFSKSEPKQAASSISNRCKKKSLNEVVSALLRHFDDAKLNWLSGFQMYTIKSMEHEFSIHFETGSHITLRIELAMW